MMEELTKPSTDQVEENELGETFIEWYALTLTDYIHKMTIASVLFFITYLWMAFFWPPYYFMGRRK
jgi:uncharacterized PurR-regulated membrane protein YhhQ (DUF165 family)